VDFGRQEKKKSQGLPEGENNIGENLVAAKRKRSIAVSFRHNPFRGNKMQLIKGRGKKTISTGRKKKVTLHDVNWRPEEGRNKNSKFLTNERRGEGGKKKVFGEAEKKKGYATTGKRGQ